MTPRQARSLHLAMWLLITAKAASADAMGELRAALSGCTRHPDAAAKLKCFERLALAERTPTYAGRHNFTTERFTIEAPSLLRYQSDGPIFVMYLRDSDGGVVQNLVLHGGGEDRYRIAKPGEYSLQVNGAESWRIWLEPLAITDALQGPVTTAPGALTTR